MSFGRCVALTALIAAAPASGAGAQGYRAAVDIRGQTVALRGWALDSIAAAGANPAGGGGFVSPDGFAVDCRQGAAFCYFYRPGERQNAVPLTAEADVSIWGLGITGLSLHGNVRAAANAKELDWAGTRPAVQFWEGYARYENRFIDARAGRQTLFSRLGVAGFDGGQVTLRSRSAGLYGGG